MRVKRHFSSIKFGLETIFFSNFRCKLTVSLLHHFSHSDLPLYIYVLLLLRYFIYFDIYIYFIFFICFDILNELNNMHRAVAINPSCSLTILNYVLLFLLLITNFFLTSAEATRLVLAIDHLLLCLISYCNVLLMTYYTITCYIMLIGIIISH